MYERRQQSIKAGTANDPFTGEPLPFDSASGLPILVHAQSIRIGQMTGEVAPGFFEADLCFYDVDGKVINSMSATVFIDILKCDLRDQADRWNDHTNTTDDADQLRDALLASAQWF